jgi:hypothetical protein
MTHDAKSPGLLKARYYDRAMFKRNVDAVVVAMIALTTETYHGFSQQA